MEYEMSCRVSEKLLKETIAFHGHNCPGLTIGIRAAEFALQSFEDAEQADLVCVTETDMCAVDGIQYLTGCTFGKGNLIHLDYGKVAFSFFTKTGGRGKRFVLRKDAKEREGSIPDAREEVIALLMEKSLDELFDTELLEKEPPRSARVLQSLECQSCGEQTMESRTRRFSGETLCIPCFEMVEQKR